MKNFFFSSLIAVLMMVSCQSEIKKEDAKTDTTTEVAPPPPVRNETVADSVSPSTEPTPQDNQIYDFVGLDNPPTYPGGIAKLYQFLGQNIKYPPLATEKKIEGNVHLTFTVEKDGSIRDVKVERKLGYGTDEEAVRVLKLSKKWNPGMDKGKLVRVKYALPIKFSLK